MTVAIIVLALVVVALLYDRAATRVAAERERAQLLQRIQAPDRAVEVHERSDGTPAAPRPRPRQQPGKSAAVIPLEDDDAMNRALGVTDGGS